MKYLILLLLFTSCAVPKKAAPIPKTNPTRHERLLNCVDRYIEKDVLIKEAFEVCRGIYKRG